MVDTTDGPAVAWDDAAKTFPGGHQALRGVSLRVERGEVLAILGTSGSGKTTLLKLVNRLIDPTSGTIRVLGKATVDWDPIALRRSTGYVIQEAGLMPADPALLSVAQAAEKFGMSRKSLNVWMLQDDFPLRILKRGSRLALSARQMSRYMDGELEANS